MWCNLASSMMRGHVTTTHLTTDKTSGKRYSYVLSDTDSSVTNTIQETPDITTEEVKQSVPAHSSMVVMRHMSSPVVMRLHERRLPLPTGAARRLTDMTRTTFPRDSGQYGPNIRSVCFTR